MSERPLSSIIIRNLMLEALSYEQNDLGIDNDTFKKYGYRGNQGALFRITELIAIKHGLIDKVVNIPVVAWGAEGRRLYSGSNTNFTPEEIQALYEAFWLLLNQHIIAPGAYGESPALPTFHVTPHGLKCLKAKEVLPYDIDGYLAKISSIPNIDSWVETYMKEAIRCFNADCHHASTIMIGLAAEKLTIELIDAFKVYLAKHQSQTLNIRQNSGITGPLDAGFNTEVNSKMQISQKYNTFQKFYDGTNGHPQDVKDCMENSSRKVFYDYTRLTRNEVSHPNDLKKDYNETLLLFVSFIKYIDLITNLTNKLRTV